MLFRVGVSAPTQVHLRVRVAEVSRDVLKEFGINWEAIFQNSDFAFGFVTGRPVTDAASNFLRAPTADSAFGSWEGGDDFVNTAIDALAEEGLVNILAEPNLTALSGETASFLAGGEFPIPIDSDEDGLTIEFKEFGISLAFTPTVLSSNRISLRVRPEVSDLSDNGAINHRRPDHPRARDPARRDHGRARQRPELRDRRPAVERHREQRSASSPASATFRCSARCSARRGSRATRPSW